MGSSHALSEHNVSCDICFSTDTDSYFVCSHLFLPMYTTCCEKLPTVKKVEHKYSKQVFRRQEETQYTMLVPYNEPRKLLNSQCLLLFLSAVKTN